METAPNVVMEPEHTVPGSILLLSYLSLCSDRKELDITHNTQFSVLESP